MSKEAFERLEDSETLTEGEVERIEERVRLSSPAIYEIIRLEGEEELVRPFRSLWWSGVAAGISIGLSVFGMALFRAYLPDAPWRVFFEAFGYSLGFVVVVVGHQQLFTENTITAVLPALARNSPATFLQMFRLWAIVLAANMVGCAIFAAFALYAPGLPTELKDAMLAIARHLMESSWTAMLAKGVVSGFLIAAMVWVSPSAPGQDILVVMLLTGMIAALDATHIVSGTADVLLLVFNGEVSLLDMVWRFSIPVLIGNVVGGTALFTLLAYGQVMAEIEADTAEHRPSARPVAPEARKVAET